MLVPSARSNCNVPVKNIVTTRGIVVPGTIKISVNYKVDFIRAGVPIRQLVRVRAPGKGLTRTVTNSVLQGVPANFRRRGGGRRYRSITHFLRKVAPRRGSAVPRRLVGRPPVGSTHSTTTAVSSGYEQAVERDLTSYYVPNHTV